MRAPWKVGVEVELLAPAGSSRYTLAELISKRVPGSELRRVFHHESEPSKVVGQPVFENLTLGFEVYDARGALIARCVDDLTIQDELERAHPPLDGWFRVVSDEARLLRLTARHADLSLGLPEALMPVAELFGSALELCAGGMYRLCDPSGASILIAAPLPGERERPCELITPPLEGDREERLRALLDPANELGFTVPVEGALHIHFDSTLLKSAPVLRRLIETFHQWGEPLKTLVRVNPRCQRLGPWDPAVIAAVQRPHFDSLSWRDASAILSEQPLTKFCDFNLTNMIIDRPNKSVKDTFEVRISPSTLEVDEALFEISLFESILYALVEGDLMTSAPSRMGAWRAQLIQLIDELGRRSLLNRVAAQYWEQRALEL